MVAHRINQPTNVFSDLGDTTMTIQVRYTDQTCLNLYGNVSLTVPIVTIVDVGDVTPTDPSACGLDDGQVVIAPSQGDNHEYSIDGGTTYQGTGTFSSLAGGTYIITVRNSVTNSCNDTTSVALAGNVAPSLSAKVFLQGPYNSGTGLMGDGLRTNGIIPLDHPYSTANLEAIGADTTNGSNGLTPHLDDINIVNVASGQLSPSITDSAGVFADRGSNSAVDWIVLELRAASDSATITTRRMALLQRDGDIVEWSDGISTVKFVETCASSSETYFVSVKHRNHLGVMTAAAIDFSAGDAVSLDFTDGSVETYRKPGQIVDIEPQATVGGIRALWGGNVAFNRRILFQGDNPDASLIAKPVTESLDNPDGLANFILDGYFNSDVNMDGRTIFQGSPNDVDILFFNIMGNPANTSFNANFTLAEQLPE